MGRGEKRLEGTGRSTGGGGWKGRNETEKKRGVATCFWRR